MANHGKYREHRQGRYMKYGEETVTVRIPHSLIDECHEWVVATMATRRALARAKKCPCCGKGEK